MSNVVFPAQHQMLRGLVIARWVAFAWMAGQLVVARSAADSSADHLDHPLVAVAVLAAVAWLNVFGSQLALASSWPLVAVLSVAIVHGHRVGLVAGAFVPTGCILGAQISGAEVWTQNHVLSFASSIVFYAAAGA